MKRADKVWQQMIGMVMESREDWRRKVADTTGMPFSRVRALRRIVPKPLSLGELAYAMACDAPAATVAVNDLEKRGLVARRRHPDDARAKLVSATAAGRKMLTTVDSIEESAPATFSKLDADELATLARLIGKLA